MSFPNMLTALPCLSPLWRFQHFALWALHRRNAMNSIKHSTVHTNATPKDCLDIKNAKRCLASQ